MQDDDQEAILMPNKDGEKFLCYLPKVDKPKIGKPLTPNISSLVVDTEKRIKWKTPDELLEVLKDRCLIRVRIHLILPFPPDLNKLNIYGPSPKYIINENLFNYTFIRSALADVLGEVV